MSSQFPLNAPLPPVRPEEVDEFAGFEPFAPVAAAAPAAGAPVDEFAGFEPMTATPLPSPASPARTSQPGFWDRATQFVDDLIPDSLAGQPDPGATGIGGAIAANSVPVPEAPPSPLAQNVLEVGKGVPAGAVRMGGTAVKGAAGTLKAGEVNAFNFGPEQVAVMDRIDRGEAVPEMEDVIGYQHMDPTQRAQVRQQMNQAIAQTPAPAQLKDSTLFQAGQAVEDYGSTILPAAPGYEQSLGRQLGEGLGSMVAGAAVSAAAGPVAAGAFFSLSGAGEAVDRAVKAGATEDQILESLKYGYGAGATDLMPVEVLLGRIPLPGGKLIKVPANMLGSAMKWLGQVGTQALIEGTQEALQGLIQNFGAREVYNPNQALVDGLPHDFAMGAGVGALAEAGMSILMPGRHRGPSLQNAQPTPQPDIPAGAQPAEEIIGADPGAGHDVSQAGFDAVSQALQPPASQAGLAAVQQALAPQGAAPIDPAAGVAMPNGVTAYPNPASATGWSDANGQATLPPPPAAEPTIETKAGQVGVSAVQEALAQPMDLDELLDDPRPLEEIQAERAEIAKQAELAAAQGQVDQTVAQLDTQAAPQVVEATKAQLGAPVTADNVRDYVSLLDQGMQALGTKDAPVKLDTPEAVNAGAQVTATPTQAQAEAGNYSKRHLKWKGLDIAIETEQGQERSGVDQNGNAWSVPMPAPYGYIKRTTGADGDHIDVYVGPKPQAAQVFIIDQVDAESGKFDEHKVMIGYGSEAEALAAHQAAFSDGRGAQRMGAVSAMTPQQFKQWVKNGNAKKPIAYKGPKKGAPGKRQPKTLLQHLIAIGGINPTQEAHRGELRARDVHNKFVPGWGRLVTKKGVDLDKAREHAIELGYLQQGATVDDLLNLIEGEATGKQRARTATETRDGWAQLDDEQDPAEREYQARSAIADALDDLGFADTDIDGEALNIAAAQVLEGETDLVAAYDAAIQILAEQEPAIAKGKLEADIPFFGDATYENATPDSRPEHGYGEDHPLSGQSDERAQESAVSAPGERSGADSQVQGRDGRPEGQAPEVDPFEAAFAAGQDEADAAQPTTEKGADGKPQLVIPGAEKVGDGDLAQLKADKPLQAKAPQQAMDEGLFGDGHNQVDMFDAPPAPQADLLGEPVALNEQTRAWKEALRKLADEYEALGNKARADVIRKTVENPGNDWLQKPDLAWAEVERIEGKLEEYRAEREAQPKVTPIDPANVPNPVNGKALTNDPDNTLVLMACSEAKSITASDTKALPLFELYNGPLWQDLRAKGKALLNNVYAISGKLGFKSAATRSPFYNEKISKEKVDAIISRGVDGLPTTRNGVVFGMSVYAEVHRDTPYSQVIIYGSGDYRRGFNAIVAQLQEAGVITEGAPIVATEGSILQQRKQFNEFLRQAQGQEKEQVATKAEPSAKTSTDDGYTFRETPEGQPTVADLVKPGMTIRTSYGTGGKVLSVDGPFTEQLQPGGQVYPPSYTIVLTKNGKKPDGWINELVAVDGRILKLFENNDDEVFLEAEAAAAENPTIPPDVKDPFDAAFEAGQEEADQATAPEPAKKSNTYPVSQAQLNQLVKKYLPKGWTASFNADETRVFLHPPRPKGKRAAGGPIGTGTLNEHAEVLAHFKAMAKSFADEAVTKDTSKTIEDGSAARMERVRELGAAAFARGDERKPSAALGPEGKKEWLAGYDAASRDKASGEPAPFNDRGHHIGQRVQVRNKAGDEIYRGTIEGHNATSGRISVKSDDGNVFPVEPERVHGFHTPTIKTTGGGDPRILYNIEKLDDGGEEDAQTEAKPKRDTRSTKDVAKSAVKNAVSAADNAMAAASALFNNKNRPGSGPTWDEETWAQAKPLFITASQKFIEFKNDVAELVRRMVVDMRTNFGLTRDGMENMKPYMRRFIEELQAGTISLEGEQDVPGSSENLESDSGDTEAADGLGAADVRTAAGGTGRGAGRRGRADRGGGERQSDGSDRVSVGDAPAVGERGDSQVSEGEPGTLPSDSAAGERGRSGDAGEQGFLDNEPGAGTVEETASDAPSLEEKERRQKAAEKIDAKPGIANIRETLPMLLPQQQDDVLKAETRFEKSDGHGMLFTNGTGTGKTWSGAGIVKRFVKRGKKNVLIVAPTQGILEDWAKTLKRLHIDASVLESTQDKGKGIVLTTYANLGENRHLAERDWDLVVSDESQNLMAAQDATETDGLSTLRAITNHPRGLQTRARHVLRDLDDKITALNEQQKAADKRRDYSKVEELQLKLEPLNREYRQKADALIAKYQAQERSKVVFLSATPFAYDQTIDYAEGYLFEYGPDPRDKSSAYNTPDARGQFFIQHFGYRMRTGRLTKPDAGVNSEIMERQFHEMLKAKGSLSGRVLDVDADYERHFALAHDAIGAQIDEALTWLSDVKSGRTHKFGQLHDLVQQRFDYLSRQRLLEAIKAHAAVPMISKDLALGRKIVVFHDFNDGAGFDPFAFNVKPETEYKWKKPVRDERGTLKMVDEKTTWGEVLAEFHAANPAVKTMNFSKYTNPIETLTKAFPKALVYNGRIPNKKRSEAKRLFQEDNSGYDIIIVQSAAGEAGISLHDTTGTHQRALHNLGMPVKPTTAIQEEGRIYRTGQISDAIFRYYNTGTNWERWAFARKIAERASTAENLALGNEARTLKQSFIDAFNDADTVEPKTGEGKGGKQRDRALAGAITPFKRALTLYWAQQKNTKRRDQREGNDYFATPEPLGLKMVEWAGVKPGDRVLEPSAGHGAIARFFPDHANRTVIEQSGELLGRAALNVPGAKTVHEDFEDHHITNKYDVIVMNPPFGVGGKLAAEHVAKAATHLRNGGRIVALVPSGGKADERFEALLDDLFTKGVLKMGEVLLPGVTFERAGTGVNTRVLILEKQTDKENQEQLNEIADAPIDLRNAENIQEFFNRIELLTTAPRLEPKTEEAEALPEEGEIEVAGHTWILSKSSWAMRTWHNIQLKKRAEKGFMGRLAKIAKLIDRDFSIDGTARRIAFEKRENLEKFVERLRKGALSDDLREETAPPPEAPAGQALTRDGFELQKTMHAKLGIPIWVATNKARVDRSVYDWLVSIAKPHGGWFSSYQGRGAIPGFQFKTEAGREKFLAAATAPKAEASAAPEADRVPDGWGFADAGEKPRLDEQTIQEVAEIVGRVANLDEVRLRETIPLKATDGGAAAWNITEDSRASGMYQPMQDQNGNVKPEWDVITIALDSWRDLGLRTAYHESFHRLQSWFLTKTEFQVLEAAAQQLYDLVDADPTRKGQAKDMSAREIQAEAFAIYMHRLDQQQPLTGIPGQVRAIFAKIMRLVREVRQKLTGKGLTWQDVFEDGGKGKTARRQPNARPNYGGSAELSQRPNQVASPPSDPQQGFFAKGQFVERALQTAFSPFGGIDREGRFKPTAYLAQRHKGLLSGAAYGAAIGQLMGGPLGIVPGAVVGGAMGKVMRSRRSFGWADTFLENARRNLIDRHGLDDDYVKRGRQVDLDKRGIMAEGKAIIDHLAENKVGRAEAQVLQAILTGKAVDDADMQALAQPIRESLDQLGQEAVLLGLVSQESFERNRGTYLHRVYMKDEAGMSGLARWGTNVLTRRRRRIIGDSLKGRGIFLDVPMERLTAADPEWAEARRGRPFKGETFHILDYTPGAQADLLGGDEKSRTTRRVFWPADRPIPAKYQGQGWTDKGIFEVRNDKNPKKMTLWRDYSETERERMGEIIDSRYTIAKTYMLMSNDLATGRFYKDVAENEAWTVTQPPELPWKNAEDYRRFWQDPEIAYVKVPDTEIPNTGGKKRWGALAGQYVRAEIWRDLNEQAIIEQPSTWRRLMTQWKLNKTARNPVVHLNNIMSNLMFMDLADVRAQDLIAGLRSYTTQDQHYQDAARHGAFGADQMSQEIRDKVLKPLLEEIQGQESNGVNPFLAKAGLLGKFADRIWTLAQAADQKMIDVYRMEDEVFRMATYRRRLALGNTPEQAADIAREQFLDYDIRAPLINAMRNSFFPFIAYPYRAIPLLAQAIAERPWKVAKYVALFYALNTMFYWAADDDDEEKERAALRDNEQGKTWLGADRMVRMPWNDAHGLPVFLDVRRWVPAGDVYDLNQSNAAISMPPWLTPGGPIMIGAELALNRQAFTNKDIVSHLTDTPGEKAGKVADYLWKAWMPSAPWVPGSWYWEKIGTAIAGGKDSTGQAYSIPQAVLSSVGVKVKSLDIEQARRFKAMDFEREERELKGLMRNNARQRQRNLVSQKEFEKEQANIIAKLHRLASKKADYFKATSE